MIQERIGKYGVYYGSTFNESGWLTQAQIEVNVWYIYKYLLFSGWSLNAIAGVLGNMEHESGMNPGIWESQIVGNTLGGYGLVQWTPASRHINWCTERGLDPSEMDSNLMHIVWEIDDGDDYYSTNSYPLSYREFVISFESPYYLACAFAWNYERSAVVLWGAHTYAEAQTLTEAQKEANREKLRQLRGNSANKWYQFICGEPPPDFPAWFKKKRKMPIWMYLNYL